jgi:PAS domain S-box-containing protein
LLNKPLQTLDDLRGSPEAAWLWDVTRRRVVWANAAGVAAFDAASVFELVDRPFDPEESGLQTLSELQQSLSRESAVTVVLDFPSLGKADALTCDCWVHTLADGRDGIIAVAHSPARTAAFSHFELFEDLPAATCALAQTGGILFANEMARSLFDSKSISHLAQLLLPEAQAENILRRLGQTRLVSVISSYVSPYGSREARFTLKRTHEDGEIHALMTMEDITERRQLEREIQTGQQGALGQSERQAFEDIGRKISGAVAPPEKPQAPTPARQQALEKTVVAEKPSEPPKPAPKAASAIPAQPAASIAAAPAFPFPKPLLEAFEKSPLPLAICQNGRPAYANQMLARLLGYPNTAALMASKSLWQALSHLPIREGLAALPKADGGTIELVVNRQVVPWQNGGADQFKFEQPRKRPGRHAEPAPAPEPRHVEVPPLAAVVAEPQAGAPSSEQELRSILDIASDGIITLDKDGAIKDFSAGAEAIFGFRNAEVLKKLFISLLSPESATVVKDYLAGLDGEGLASVFNDGREVTGVVKQGGLVPLFLNIGRLQAGLSSHYCVVVRDITSWKRTERELRDAKDVAEQASRHKSDFLARVSHELRTPLNAIMGFSEIMRMGHYGEIANERYRGYLNDIHASGSHLLAMINDLLDLSKIEAGRMELNFTAVSLLDCFDHAAQLLQEQATRARVLLRRSFPENLPRVVADQRAMRQVMLNLLSNGIKYTDAGGQVIVSAIMGANGALILRLQDTGIGMTEGELKKALQPFMRIDTPGRERQGTGLGLPLTKALVEANRAAFTMSSEPHKGTLVEITFPTTRVLAD